MTPEGHNDLLPAIENVLREATEPLDCWDVYDKPEIRMVAPSVNRVSDYLGILFRKGLANRVASTKQRDGSRSRWAYIWKDNKIAPADLKGSSEIKSYRPKAILSKPNIYITEDGGNVSIELPNLSVVIKVKP